MLQLKLFKRLLLLTIFGLSFYVSRASHVQGMQIFYEHVSGTTYNLNLYLYRYCGGTAFSPNGTYQSSAGLPSNMNITYQTFTNNFQTNLILPIDTVYELDMFCPSLSSMNTCSNPGFGVMGIQVAVFKLQLDFSSLNYMAAGRLISSINARNNGTNYVGQPSISVYTTIDPAAGNSSAIPLSHDIQMVFEDSTNYQVPLTHYDIDGDSLVFELDTAIDTYSALIQEFNYLSYNNTIPGFSTVNGLEPVPGCSMNSTNGVLNVTPVIPAGYTNANYAIAWKIKEYDPVTGVLKGETQQDMQMLVFSNNGLRLPYQVGVTQMLSGGVLNNNHMISTCAQTNFCYEVTFADSNLSDTLYGSLQFDSSMISASIVQTGMNPATFLVCGSILSASQQSHNITLKVIDNGCPYTGSSFHYMNINAECENVETIFVCEGEATSFNLSFADSVSLQMVSGSAINSSTFNCLNTACTAFELSPTQTSTYISKAYSGTFTFTDTFSINVTNQVTSSITVSSINCQNQPFEVSIDVANAANFDVLWQASSGVISSTTNDTITVSSSNVGPLTLDYNVNVNNTCFDSGSVQLTINPTPVWNGFAGLSAPYCTGQSAALAAVGNYNCTFSPSTYLSDSIGQPTITFSGPITYNINFVDAYGCFNTAQETFNPTQSIVSGMAVDSSMNAITSGQAYLYEFDSVANSVSLIDSVNLDSNGKFMFVASTPQFIVAVVADTSIYADFVPSYYELSPYIQASIPMTFVACDTLDYVHEMVYSTGQSGYGSLIGNIVQGFNRDIGDPLPGLAVFAEDLVGNTLKRTLTDANGDFEFKDLAPGNYRISVDYFGVDNNLSPVISLAPDETKEDLLFVLYTDHLKWINTTRISEVNAAQKPMVYPNPTQNSITVNSLSDKLIRLFVYDLSGKLLLDIRANSTNQDVDLSSFSEGVYFLKMETESGATFMEKLIKQ